MASEFVVAGGILGCSAAYWLGGQNLPFVNRGFKWIRRFGVPAIVLGVVLHQGAPWYLALLASALLCGALHLGYQTHIWKFALTGLAMGAPALILSTFEPMQIVAALLPCLMHTVLGIWSRLDNKFGWAWVALVQGLAIGGAYAYQNAV